ncbi:MAG: hypothetical protein FJ290_23845, partial [Planctomycetes bacterium]|nr:hypothetical protein [Planctomycetota bacterium]
RRADIETYERAKRALVGSHLHLARGGHVRNEDVTPGAELTLSQSFRPVPGIAEAVNAIFKDEIAPPSDGGLYQPAYVPLHPYRDAVGERAAVALVYPPPGHDEELEKMPSARRLEARCVAAMISRIIAEGWRVEDKKERAVRPARYGDIAILAERFEYSDAYAEALADADVPLRISGGRHFYMSHEVHSLVAVLKALANPHDRLSLVAALRGPFFGVSDEELLLAKCAQGTLSYLGQECGTAGQASRATAERVPVPPAFAAATAVLREFHERRDAEPTPLLLQRLYERTKVLELFLLRPRGEQRVANLLKVVVQARALEATQRVSFRSFVRWLARLHQTEAREAESASSEAGDDTVQFLSVHAAKGLEFPIVLLVDMSKDRRHANSFCVLRGRPPQDGQFAFYLGEKKAGFQTANWPGDDYERLREDAEDARRFYVAATRARDCLLLFPGWCKGAAGPARFLREAAQPEDPDWGAVTPKGLVYDTRTLDLTPPPPRAFRLAPPAAEPRSAEAQARLAARAQWQQQVAASLATATGGRVAVSPSRLEEGLTAPSDEPEATAGSGAGRRIGSLVHRCLQRSTLDDPAAVHARLHAEAKALALSAEQIQQAARLLDTALASPLLARARAAGCQHEVPFSIIVGGGVHSRRGAPVPSHARGTAGLSSSAPVREECGTAGLSSSVLGHGDTAGQASRATGILLTGAMDLLFVENGRVVVVDFKTDAVQDEAELARRADAYTPQAAAYALAARTALCKPVAEVVLFFLSQGREWRIPVTDLLLRHAAEQVQGVASSIGT